MRFRTVLAFASIAGLLVVAGCGSDDETGAANTTTAANGATTAAGAEETKNKFINDATAACQQDVEQMQAQVRNYAKATSGKSKDALAELMVKEVLAPGFEAQIREIRALEPPGAETKQVEEIIAAIEAAITRAKKDPLAFLESTNPFSEAEQLADGYGLTSCGRI